MIMCLNLHFVLLTLQLIIIDGYESFVAQIFNSASGKYLLVNANSMSVSLVLFIAKVCLGLLIAQVWKHKLARSKSYYCASGVTPRPELRPSTLLHYKITIHH